MSNSKLSTAAGDIGVKQHEERFHDRWAASINPAEVLVDESWEAATCPEHRWIRAQLGDLHGRRVLDLGCGAGEAAVWFAKQGADVVASDISAEFLDVVHRVAGLHGVRVQTHQGDADRLDFPDDTFDVVYAGNLLHHADLDRTLEQIHRVLKPGGRVVTWDPLRHNPLIHVYRRMAMDVRTVDEHPLAIGDVRRFARWFSDVHYECFWFCTLWIFVRFFLIEHVHPSRERYWKKIIREHARLAPIYNRLSALDRRVLGAFPFLNATAGTSWCAPPSRRVERRHSWLGTNCVVQPQLADRAIHPLRRAERRGKWPSMVTDPFGGRTATLLSRQSLLNRSVRFDLPEFDGDPVLGGIRLLFLGAVALGGVGKRQGLPVRREFPAAVSPDRPL